MGQLCSVLDDQKAGSQGTPWDSSHEVRSSWKLRSHPFLGLGELCLETPEDGLGTMQFQERAIRKLDN